MKVLNHHNSKQIWNGRTWVRVPLCDNASSNTEVNLGRGIGVTPQCYDNKQEYKVIIHYSEFERGITYLCGECLKRLRKSARKYGYKVEWRKI